MDTYQHCFISNLKLYRKRAGLSQARLAELCDVSNGTIGNIECGVTKPSFDLIILMSQALNIQPEKFFQTKNEQQELQEEPTALNPAQVASLEESLIQAIQTVLEKIKN